MPFSTALNIIINNRSQPYFLYIIRFSAKKFLFPCHTVPGPVLLLFLFILIHIAFAKLHLLSL